MIIQDKKHGQLCKKVVVKIIVPGERRIVHNYRSQPGRWFTADSIAELLEAEEKRLAAEVPSVDFRLIELAPNSFNLVGAPKGQQ